MAFDNNAARLFFFWYYFENIKKQRKKMLGKWAQKECRNDNVVYLRN